MHTVYYSQGSFLEMVNRPKFSLMNISLSYVLKINSHNFIFCNDLAIFVVMALM